MIHSTGGRDEKYILSSVFKKYVRKHKYRSGQGRLAGSREHSNELWFM